MEQKIQEKFEYRMKLFHDEMAHKEAERVPVLSNVWSWKIPDCGYKLSEAVYDFDILKKTVYEFQEKYNFDAIVDANIRNPLMIARAMGNVNYLIDDEKNAITYLDQCIMDTEDYDALIENPAKYLWTTFMRKKYPGITPEKAKAGIASFGAFLQYVGEVSGVLAEKYAVPGIQENNTLAAIECLGCGMRGLKNLALDMRRREAKVLAALEAINEYMKPVQGLYATAYDGPSKANAIDVGAVFLFHTFLTPKQFAKTHLPHLNEMIEYAQKYHKSAFLFLEGENSRFYDFFQDFPKHMFSLYLESDDLFEAKKKIGDNCALVGGFPSDLLGGGTPEECAEYTKKLIDTLGEGGGYILTTNKMISYRADCRAENLKAVNETAFNYKKG